MPETQSEFLKELEPSTAVDTLDAPLTPVTEEVKEESKEESEEDHFNRRERRLQAKLQAERESSIALAARLEALTEAQKFSRESAPEVDETIARIYGTNTPEAAEATALLTKALARAEDRATEKALTRFKEEQAKERAAVDQENKTLDSMIEEIEDESRTTVDAPTRKAFFSLLERLSPKDVNGEVKEYADHHAVWEELQARRQPQNTRAKDLASRSMVRTGASPSSSSGEDATQRFLRENGII